MLDFHLTKALHAATGPVTLDVNLRIAAGEFVVLCGPSGAGKTTLLRLLAGLTPPDAGYLRVAGQPWYEAARRFALPPTRRDVGFVFQDYALFPNMTVRENLTFALPDRRQHATVTELLALMDLTALADRRPAQLSGGQQQRVALARALARRPRLLLLDEPLSAVDVPTRRRLQELLTQTHRRFGLTSVLVSHDPAEVAALASRVIELELGQVTYDGPALTEPPAPTAGLQLTGVVLEVLAQQVCVQVVGADTSFLVATPNPAQYRVGDTLTLNAPTLEVSSPAPARQP